MPMFAPGIGVVSGTDPVTVDILKFTGSLVYVSQSDDTMNVVIDGAALVGQALTCPTYDLDIVYKLQSLTGAYMEYQGNSVFPDALMWWKDSNKVIKIREDRIISRSANNFPTVEQFYCYDSYVANLFQPSGMIVISSSAWPDGSPPPLDVTTPPSYSFVYGPALTMSLFSQNTTASYNHILGTASTSSITSVSSPVLFSCSLVLTGSTTEIYYENVWASWGLFNITSSHIPWVYIPDGQESWATGADDALHLGACYFAAIGFPHATVYQVTPSVQWGEGHPWQTYFGIPFNIVPDSVHDYKILLISGSTTGTVEFYFDNVLIASATGANLAAPGRTPYIANEPVPPNLWNGSAVPLSMSFTFQDNSNTISNRQTTGTMKIVNAFVSDNSGVLSAWQALPTEVNTTKSAFWDEISYNGAFTTNRVRYPGVYPSKSFP